MTKAQFKAAAISGVLSVICAGLFILTLVHGLYEPLEALLYAESTTGTVQASTVKFQDAGKSDFEYAPVVTYQYRYDGQTYSNDNLTPRMRDAYQSETEAASVVERYPVGREVTVYVLPETPAESYLFWAAPGFWTWALNLTTLLFAVLLGIACVKTLKGEARIDTPRGSSMDMDERELSEDSVQEVQDAPGSPSNQREASRSDAGPAEKARGTGEGADASNGESGCILSPLIGCITNVLLVVFLSGFLAAAIWLGYEAVQGVRAGSVAGAVVAGGVSLLILYGVLSRIWKVWRASDSSEPTYAKPPGHYRSEWETRRVEASRTAGIESWWRMGIGVALFCPMAALVVIGFLWPSLTAGRIGAAAVSVVILLLPLWGALHFGYGLYKGVRHRLHYDRAVFEMDEMPAVLGEMLSGTVETGMSGAEEAPLEFSVELKCLKRNPHQRGWAWSYDCLWSAGTQTTGHLGPDGRQVYVPVEFRLPEAQPPSTPEETPGRILWRVDLSAEAANPPYGQGIEIPVFPSVRASSRPRPLRAPGHIPRSLVPMTK